MSLTVLIPQMSSSAFSGAERFTKLAKKLIYSTFKLPLLFLKN